MHVAIHIANARNNGQDRAAWFPHRGGQLIVVADGAGGTTGGTEAAQTVVDYVRDLADSDCDWTRVLSVLDVRLFGMAAVGETTAVVAFVDRGTVVGASVGDSAAWIVSPAGCIDLTVQQRRKPLLGSGAAEPLPFGPAPVTGRLLLGTDGLFKYVPVERIKSLGLAGPLDVAAQRLADAARLPSGRLQDDVAVVLAGSEPLVG
ncbi:MAG TPA: protein phosphatase 2C domain-containing protein [Polyangiales bacterium]|nr:protein phosphatase 2C domain-containing protein [Polyangiales bacterium]